MSTETLDLSVVIPAYGEEENLRVLLPRLLGVLEGTHLSFEVLVIDAATPIDDTKAVCEALGPRVVVCARGGGNHYGDAVRSGIARSRGKSIAFMDADGSHSPEVIPRLLAHRLDHDIVTASRYVEGGTTENPRSLIWMSRLLNGIYSTVLRIPCRDVSNSFKLYDGDLLRGLPLRCSHFDIIEEIVVRCVVAKPTLTIKEVPFVFKARKFGTTKRDLLPFVVSFHATLMRLLWIKMSVHRRPARKKAT